MGGLKRGQHRNIRVLADDKEEVRRMVKLGLDRGYRVDITPQSLFGVKYQVVTWYRGR